MNTYIWCVVGFIAGTIVAATGAVPGWTRRIETVAVAMFGAVVGGDLVPGLLPGAGPDTGAFQVSSLAFSIAGTVTMLALLSLMRRSVGPLKPHKEKRRH